MAAVSGPVGEFLQHLPTGKVRLIATSGEKRSRFAPDVPTYAEQGFKDIVFGRRLSDDEVYSPALPDILADAYRKATPVFRFLSTLDG